MSDARRAGGGALLAAFAMMTLPGCVARRQVSPPTPPSDPRALLAWVEARENRITTLRARFTAVTHAGKDEHRTDGVLLVKKADRFRMRLMLPFGPTIFDYVSWGERTQVTLPLQRISGTAPPPGFAPFSREDLGQAFLRGAYAFPGTCVPNRDSDIVAVMCRDGAGTLLRRLDIDPSNGTIRDETSFDAGGARMVLRYSDYAPAGDAYLPFHIVMSYPQRDLSVVISVGSYEVNAKLSDELFQPSRPWGS